MLQNLSYAYNPVGNVMAIRDDAQQRIFFANRRVEPSAEYTYNPVYRLVEATGREHLGQVGGAPGPPTPSGPDDSFFLGLPSPGDGAAMGTYVESYEYDDAHNLRRLRHRGHSPVHAGWTRGFDYNEVSLLEDGTSSRPLRVSNRLSRSTLQGASPDISAQTYDAHGNAVAMSHLPVMRWDYRDRLQATARGVTGAGAPATSWYGYDTGGQAGPQGRRRAGCGGTGTAAGVRTPLSRRVRGLPGVRPGRDDGGPGTRDGARG